MKCKTCGDTDTTHFYKTNGSTCKSCVSAKVQDYKRVRRDARARTVSERGPEPEPSVPCLICGLICIGGPAVLTHLHAAHTTPEGVVLGLDAVPCLICGGAYKGQLYTHLRAKHQTSAAAYINQFPWGLLAPYNPRRLERGDVHRLVPSEKPRRPRSDRMKIEVTPRKVRNFKICPVCLKETGSLKAHVARNHPSFSNMPLFDEVSPSGSNVEHTIGLAMALRAPMDVERTWPVGEERVYFVQAGGPGGPIKIGSSADVHGRLEHLQIYSPTTLRVLMTVRGDFADEQALHRLFAPFGLRGEWFRPHPLVLDYIVNANRTARGEAPAMDMPMDDGGVQWGCYEPRSDAERFVAVLKHIEVTVADSSAYVSSDVVLEGIKVKFGVGSETRDWVDMWINRIRGPRFTSTKKARVGVGQVYGHLTVEGFAGRVPASSKSEDTVRMWHCRCACGQMTTARTSQLRSGGKRSCGCLAPPHLARFQFRSRQA